jgi:predicted dehydrogenase
MVVNVKKKDRLLNVGILGCGTISQAAHFISATKADNVRLVAICDVAQDLLRKMEAVYEPRRTYARYEDMLADPEIEAVVIGVGDQFHTACAKMALLAGKHVLVEKPFGVSVADCEEVTALAKEKNLVLQIGHMKRFDGGIQFARDFVRNEIGEVTTYKGWYCDSTGRRTLCDNVMPPLYSSELMKKPAGNPKAVLDRYYLLAHGSHLFDTARFLLGEIVSLEAKLCVKGSLYSWLVACDFKSGAIGSLDLTVAVRADWHEGFEVYGTKGTVYAKTYNPWVLLSSEVECWKEDTRVGLKPYAADGHSYRRQMEAFADVVLHGKKQDGADGEDGTAALRALIATFESSRNGGAKVYLRDVKGGI